MAIVKEVWTCPYCGKEVSPRAKDCPHCGEPLIYTEKGYDSEWEEEMTVYHCRAKKKTLYYCGGYWFKRNL